MKKRKKGKRRILRKKPNALRAPKERRRKNEEGRTLRTVVQEKIDQPKERRMFKIRFPENLLKQLMVTLCILEKKFNFEHRDLHTGNILLKYTKLQPYVVDGKRYQPRASGSLCYMMDFGLSLFGMGCCATLLLLYYLGT
ncbi:hypothetical protein TTRE_0000380501 [Trichuris trichiura]|uniref:Protein kinase domain-containing protein n=1 Tax=Trichuris trichiura TaxID=36087 RepID=A0A077Z7A7_TRITR|nr:hypothetical protein TTRE_0000380501 [Trichuris trichiura]